MTNERTIRLGLIQPRSFWGSEEEQNVAAALDWLHRCAESSVQLVVFPEGYPGPTNPINRYDALPPLAEKAAQLGLHVVAGNIEPATEGGYHVAVHLIDDHGQTTGSYRRTHPRDTHVYRDIEMWGFDYRGSSKTRRSSSRLLLDASDCWFAVRYIPELSRALALQDADVIVYPAGGGQGEIIPNWQTVLAARALRTSYIGGVRTVPSPGHAAWATLITVTTSNGFGRAGRGSRLGCPDRDVRLRKFKSGHLADVSPQSCGKVIDRLPRSVASLHRPLLGTPLRRTAAELAGHPPGHHDVGRRSRG